MQSTLRYVTPVYSLISCSLALCCATPPATGAPPAESFIAPRDQRSDRSRCLKLREHLMEQLTDYADAVIDELSFWAQMLEQEQLQEQLSEKAHASALRRLKQLAEAETFIGAGTIEQRVPVIEATRASAHHRHSTVIRLVNQIARVQRSLMGALRDLLVGNADCCFVRTRKKHELERHITTAQHLIQDSRDITRSTDSVHK